MFNNLDHALFSHYQLETCKQSSRRNFILNSQLGFRCEGIESTQTLFDLRKLLDLRY